MCWNERANLRRKFRQEQRLLGTGLLTYAISGLALRQTLISEQWSRHHESFRVVQAGGRAASSATANPKVETGPHLTVFFILD